MQSIWNYLTSKKNFPTASKINLRQISNILGNCFREATKQAYLYALLYAATQGITYYMYGLSFRTGGWLVEIGEMKANTVYT